MKTRRGLAVSIALADVGALDGAAGELLRQRTSRIWYSSLADLTPRIDPYSVVIGSARRSEFQSKLACPLEGLRRIARRECHGSCYVRKASASRGGKHR